MRHAEILQEVQAFEGVKGAVEFGAAPEIEGGEACEVAERVDAS